ncbi:WbuC family cupin fold metalloprotein [Uliginosibacterium flavum]|uniref:WbuC family cupin fold metalloprotein n=1 Tax=Uliginosibacterium flavum TaxID=1396831 RepID=A0ABV2TL62_9RHOO
MSAELFDQSLLDQLSRAARANPRLRQNHNLHTSPDDPVQRFFNAIEPGSYVIPHRHLAADKAETLLMLRGRIGLILFDEQGQITATHVLAPTSACSGFHLRPGCWHSVIALESGSVFFETKAGPYLPLTAAERAPWAPAEGTAAAATFEADMRQAFI